MCGVCVGVCVCEVCVGSVRGVGVCGVGMCVGVCVGVCVVCVCVCAV